MRLGSISCFTKGPLLKAGSRSSKLGSRFMWMISPREGLGQYEAHNLYPLAGFSTNHYVDIYWHPLASTM